MALNILPTEKMARVCARHPWHAIFTWLCLIVIGVMLTITLLQGAMTTSIGFTDGPESKRADDLLAERFPEANGVQELVIVKSRDLTVDDAAYQDYLQGLRERLELLQEEDVIQDIICYDYDLQQQIGSALEMASSLGIEMLTEEQYRGLQELGEFDRKTSSWVKTPAKIRDLGGALFCDRRYDHVFLYHNGAESYYAARGFRGILKV